MSSGLEWLKQHQKAAVGVLAAVVVAAAAGFMLVRFKAKEQKELPEEKVYTVRVFTAESSGNAVSVKYTGLVQPQELIQCFANNVGTIQQLLVKEGDTVQKGQVLARLDTGAAQQQAEHTAGALQSAKNNVDSLTRARDAARADYEAACEPASAEKLNEARAQRDAAQADVNKKQSELDRVSGLLAPQEQKVANAQAAYQNAAQAVTPARETAAAAAQKQKTAAAAAQQAETRLTAAQESCTTAAAAVDSAAAAVSAAEAEVSEAQAALDAAVSPEEQTAAAARLDAANAAKSQADAALGNAQSSLDTANAEQQAAKDAKASADAAKTAADEEKASADQALTDAQAGESKALAALTAEQTALTAKKASLGYAPAQAAVTAAQTQLEARQTVVDALEREGEKSALAKAQRQRLDTAESALLQAQTFYDGAKRSNDTARDAAADNQLRAPAAGTIVKLVGAEGGLASPLAPVAVIAGIDPVVQFGVSQSDVKSLQLGMDATVTLDGRTYHGSISSIAPIPDETTRTYPVNVSVETGEEELLLGSMAQVELGVGERTGVWLPLAVILNDGEDYVYIVQDGHALRRDVQIAQVSNDRVLVNGLEAGCRIISQGMKTVRSGSAVRILDESGGDVE